MLSVIMLNVIMLKVMAPMSLLCPNNLQYLSRAHSMVDSGPYSQTIGKAGNGYFTNKKLLNQCPKAKQQFD
jgi:hypothetical protein